MQHFLEILKIVDGALRLDRDKVTMYVDLLAVKLEAEGEIEAAANLRKLMTKGTAKGIHLSRLSPTERVPADTESGLSLADEQHFDAIKVEVFLSEDTTSIVEEFLRYVRAADKLLAHGIGISPSLLAYGPPGCGKTELARYIAAQLGLPLLTARVDTLISSYLGSTSKNIRLLFEHAMGRPCVLFLDDFDAMAKLRDDHYELGELKRVVVSLLQNIDALDNRTILLAATNHEHLLDAAIWRRFAYKVQVPLPNEDIRVKLLRKFIGPSVDELNLQQFILASKEMSGAEIRQIIEDCRREAIVSGAMTISGADIVKRIIRLKVASENEVEPSLEAQIFKAHELDAKVFSCRKLEILFGVSKSKVSYILQRAKKEHVGQDSSSN